MRYGAGAPPSGSIPRRFMNLTNSKGLAERTQTDIETIRRLGRKSSAFVKKMVRGKRVRLEYDQANAAIGQLNRYGRTLV